jgi:hypothetical protein
MNTVRNIAAGLLALTGVVHVAQLAKGFDATVAIIVLFGVAYLAIAYFLYRGDKRSYWFGAIVPLIGLLLSVPGMLAAPNLLAGFFIVVDAIVIVACAYLIYKK